MDDLSFEEFEIEYKYLKAVIEGGLEKKPDNILIYATSNRRHLVREKSSDKLEIMDDDDLHSSDTVQEKPFLPISRCWFCFISMRGCFVCKIRWSIVRGASWSWLSCSPGF